MFFFVPAMQPRFKSRGEFANLLLSPPQAPNILLGRKVWERRHKNYICKQMGQGFFSFVFIQLEKKRGAPLIKAYLHKQQFSAFVCSSGIICSAHGHAFFLYP